MEAKIAAASGLDFAAIPAGKFRRYHNDPLLRRLTDVRTLALNVRDLGRFSRGVAASLRILRRFRPDVVFIKGGYVGLPVGLAAGLLHIPYVIHESDTVPGLTNRTLAKRAAAVATGFPVDRYRAWRGLPLHYTGSPIRQELIKAHRLEGLTHFKLSGDRPVVLVVGGSSGAEAVNEAVVAALPELTETAEVLHVAGERNFEHVRFLVKRLKLQHPERYQLFGFMMAEMAPALAAADLVISRAGATAIAELAALGKPTILIPAAHLVGGHQTENATALARAAAVRVLTESRLNGHSLLGEIRYVLGSAEEQESLSKHIKEFARPDAAQNLAQLILTQAKPESPKNQVKTEEVS